MKLALYVAVVVYSLAVQLVVDTTAQSDGVDCAALASAGDCDFYTQCVEAKFQCGRNGYPLGYGDRYCRRFSNNLNCFTSEGQNWVNGARTCLMNAILNSNLYSSNTTTCKELQEFAFDSHPSCYADNGFCSIRILLSNTNLQCLKEVFDRSDFLNKLAIQQVLDTAILCSKSIVDSFLSTVGDWISSAINSAYRQLLIILEDLLGSCNSGLDIVFVLDSSGSIGSDNFVTIKTFVNTIISNFEIGDSQTHIGVIRFSSIAEIVIPLGKYNDANLLSGAVSSIIYTSGGTDTSQALELLNTAFATARTSEGIPRVAIVITDGQSNDPPSTIQAAQAVHASGITVFSFGIGNTDANELNAIASIPSNVFYISSFSSDNFAAQLVPLQTKACTTPAIANIDEAIEGIIARSETRLLEYAFPDEGLTLKIDIQIGGLLVHGSFTIRNPTSLTADFSVESDNEGIDYFVSPELFRSSTNADGGGRRKRQASNSTSNNVYFSMIGLQDNNTFFLNTTFGDTTTSGGELSAKVMYLPLLALMAILVIVLQ